ncbi:uncharacterized mitochondrial protein AtMg00860-like [Glycine max]|uniref:uncharacterized mitochondrial protein AtMg00860-like n=1 Tax=Glycine max TaxID=3847 RepID=UPI00071919A3|nr:uncharacterized mitochondrial protein AtMg00860-like [Glycine max]|eukprot:XP_014633938.1 uncharacterized protein LOC106799557 [Glycine max]
MEANYKPVRQPQRRLNPSMKEEEHKEVLKLLEVGLIYPILDSAWVSPVQLNDATRKDHFPLPFMDQMLERRMPFGLCNASTTFQRCMLAIFADMRDEETNLVMNREKCHFMVQEGIVLGHKISARGIEVDKAKINVIEKLPPPVNVKGIRSFLGHASFYMHFIKDISKIAKPLSNLLNKDDVFKFDEECLTAFQTLKDRLVSTSVIIAPDWSQEFELMCDARDYAVGAVLGQ